MITDSKALTLASPCRYLKGVGPVLAKKLERLSCFSIQDLLFHLPYRFQDRTRITPLVQAKPNEWVVIEGSVTKSNVVYGKRRALHVHVADDSGHITIIFFYFNNQQRIKLSQVGARLRCYGEVRWGRGGMSLIHPEYQVLCKDQSLTLEKTLTPIYPLVDGVSQKVIRQCIQQALDCLVKCGQQVDLLPPDVLALHHLPSLVESLRIIHAPPKEEDANALIMGQHPAQKRLILEELAAHQVSLLQMRKKHQQLLVSLGSKKNDYINNFVARLGFSLTAAQHRVVSEISQDISQDKPMMRLLQGDVGSGKTVVAAHAILNVIERSGRAALMAPTELLAEQHYQHFKDWFEPLGLRVLFLTGQLKAKEKRNVHSDIASGEFDLVVGTHALFQDQVVYAGLSLVVVDEQHRFGVEQRLSLWRKGHQQQYSPHQMIMTATPIPRTLSMLAYADLDCSIIDELPSGRQPIKTVVISSDKRSAIIDKVVQHCEDQQCYWVCTLIDESEVLQCQAAEKTHEMLCAQFPSLSVGLVHGRMSADEKLSVMRSFKNNDIKLLVATTVIEVGVDVPNATLMVIENAERLGLSQLHQLRGRVGRGAKQSHCMLLYKPPLSYFAKERLSIMRESQDGFVIAEKDLSIRGPGELMGTRQTGVAGFQICQIARDHSMIETAKNIAENLVFQHPDVIPMLVHRWLKNKDAYVNV